MFVTFFSPHVYLQKRIKLSLTSFEDLSKRVEILQELGIWPVCKFWHLLTNSVLQLLRYVAYVPNDQSSTPVMFSESSIGNTF